MLHHCKVLQWCNMQAYKIIISACTADFRPTLMYQSISADLRQQHFTSFCAVCGVLFYYKRESTVVSSGVRDVTLMTHICSHSAVCLHATFCNQTWYCGGPRWAGMSCKKMGFYLQGQGHSVGLYNQNVTVSTISFISSIPMSLLQPNSIWMWIIISKEVSNENVGLLCSRSMSQPRLKVSLNVSLDDTLCITEPFVTKPSMVRHHYKPECHMQETGFYLQGQGHSNWTSVHTIKYDYFCYMLWTADFLGWPT